MRCVSSVVLAFVSASGRMRRAAAPSHSLDALDAFKVRFKRELPQN